RIPCISAVSNELSLFHNIAFLHFGTVMFQVAVFGKGAVAVKDQDVIVEFRTGNIRAASGVVFHRFNDQTAARREYFIAHIQVKIQSISVMVRKFSSVSLENQLGFSVFKGQRIYMIFIIFLQKYITEIDQGLI